MKPGAIISLLSSNCSLSNLEVKKKIVTVLVNWLFYHKDLERSCTGEPARAPLGHPGSRQPLWATRCPLAPLWAGGWTGQPPEVPSNLYKQSVTGWLSKTREHLQWKTKNKKKKEQKQRVHSWCGKAKILLWIVLYSFIRDFSFFSFIPLFFANHCQCQSQY